jgi:hypothetical protein
MCRTRTITGTITHNHNHNHNHDHNHDHDTLTGSNLEQQQQVISRGPYGAARGAAEGRGRAPESGLLRATRSRGRRLRHAALSHHKPQPAESTLSSRYCSRPHRVREHPEAEQRPGWVQLQRPRETQSSLP